MMEPNRTETVVTREADPAANRPVDLVRWGPVIAGIFAALSTLITLMVLGLAVGLATYDPNDDLGNVGFGASIWGAVSVLLAFFVGGWLAARSAAVGGHGNGILNGAMVWFVAIPLLLYMLGGGIGAILSTAAGVAGTAAQAVVPAVGQVAVDPGMQATSQAVMGTAQAGGQLEQSVQATAQAVATAVNVTPQDVENVADTASQTAWGTLLSLGLAAAAAIGGGYLGARQEQTQTSVVRTSSTL